MRPIATRRAAPLLLGFALVLTLAWAQPAHSQEEDSARVAGFKRAGDALKAMHRLHLPQGELTKLAAAAREIRDWGQQIPAQFPPGSDGPDDRARPEIWEDFTRFTALADAMAARAEAVAQEAERGDKAAIALALDALGDSCSACHRRFRFRR